MKPVIAANMLLLIVIVASGWPTTSTVENIPLRPPVQRVESVKTRGHAEENPEKAGEKPPRKPNIPPLDTIKSIVAESYGHPLPIADVGPFVVPKKDYESLLKHFREAEFDNSPWWRGDDELGTARLILVGGRSIRICWFWHGHKNRLFFTIGGVRYRAVGKRFADDENLAVDAIVRGIYNVEVLHSDRHSAPLVMPAPN